MSETETNYPEGAVRVLDKGFVRLVDVMGDDSSIVQWCESHMGRGLKTVNEDEGLFAHQCGTGLTPFEMVEFKFHCRMPICGASVDSSSNGKR